MSKSSRRRSDDEFKPSSAKKAKHKPEEHQSVQRIRLLDLIKCNFLGPGEEVFVKEQEGVITERGTIKVLSGSGYIEYSNPTSWTKQVTGRENGGWGQIRLKSSKQTLSAIKEQYQKSVASLDYMDDTESKQIAYHPSTDQLNSSTSSQPPAEAPPADLTLPLKVRFIGDEDRVFKIIWVSPDFKEFHTEYQGNLYTNLADFVNKIFEDFQKPSTDPNAAPPGNLRFDELMYELSPGKWVRLAGNLFPSELMAHNGQPGVEQPYQASIASQPHILQQSLQHSLQPAQQSLSHPLSYSTSTTTPDHRSATASNSNTSVDGNHLNDTHNTSFDDYGVDDEDEDDEDYVIHSNDRKRRSSGTGKSRNHHHLYNSSNSISNSSHGKGRFQCYKCLVYAESDTPIRVNCFGPVSVKDVMHTVLTESGLKSATAHASNGNELELLREYNIEIEDQDFGGVKIAFPRSIANFPTKCKITIRRKEPEHADQITEKEADKESEGHTEGDKEKEKVEKTAPLEDDEPSKDLLA